MNAEWSAMKGIDRSREKRLELSPMMGMAYQKANREVLSNPDYSIQESDFAGVYDSHSIAADIALGDRLHRQFEARQTPQEANTKKIADVFEAITLMEAEQSNWLGNATTSRTARYDDYVNKTDMLAEWKTPESGSQVLALGIDVTFGVGAIEKKIAAIKDEIDRGQLGSLRYFKDTRGDFMGTRNNVPRTIIGISQPVVEELAGLWVNKKTKELGGHPIQRALVSQMAVQLHAMQQYALARENHAMAQSYQESLAIIKRVRERGSTTPLGTLADDPVWQEIKSQTQRQFAI